MKKVKPKKKYPHCDFRGHVRIKPMLKFFLLCWVENTKIEDGVIYVESTIIKSRSYTTGSFLHT